MGAGRDFPALQLDVSYRTLPENTIDVLKAPVEAFVQNMDEVVRLSQLTSVTTNIVKLKCMALSTALLT
jgi:hypothetical protein